MEFLNKGCDFVIHHIKSALVSAPMDLEVNIIRETERTGRLPLQVWGWAAGGWGALEDEPSRQVSWLPWPEVRGQPCAQLPAPGPAMSRVRPASTCPQLWILHTSTGTQGPEIFTP